MPECFQFSKQVHKQKKQNGTQTRGLFYLNLIRNPLFFGHLVRLNFVETCRLTSLIDLPNVAIALQTKRKSNK